MAFCVVAGAMRFVGNAGPCLFTECVSRSVIGRKPRARKIPVIVDWRDERCLEFVLHCSGARNHEICAGAEECRAEDATVWRTCQLGQ